MNPFRSSKTRGLPAVAALALAGALLPVQAGSLSVHDPDGSQWQVIEDPADDADDYLVKHWGPDRGPDRRYGSAGGAAFSLGPDNDAPSSLRVEASNRRAWVCGSTISGNRPQAVILRFDANGNPDPKWGVQGRVQVTPSGLAVRPYDLVPLVDGSVLVAGEVPNGGDPRAVVFHLRADGSVDTAFGSGGVWLRPGAEPSVATGLAVGADGGVATSVSVRGPKPAGEVWSLGTSPPSRVAQQALDDSTEEDDTRIQWAGDHWDWVTIGGATFTVPAASLIPRPTPAVATAPAASADPGGSAYNPFAERAAVAAPAKSRPDDDGIPWLWIGVAAALALGLTALFFRRPSSPRAPSQTFRR